MCEHFLVAIHTIIILIYLSDIIINYGTTNLIFGNKVKYTI